MKIQKSVRLKQDAYEKLVGIAVAEERTFSNMVDIMLNKAIVQWEKKNGKAPKLPAIPHR
jgi:predicted CopG family antitoxin